MGIMSIMASKELTFLAIDNIPHIKEGDDLCTIIIHALTGSDNELQEGDVLCLAQKIVSKSEGRVVNLTSVSPSNEAIRIAEMIEKDPRLVELILAESKEIVAIKKGVIIVEHNSGVILANAGIDHSNVDNSVDGENVLLLPTDPDASAKQIHTSFKNRLKIHIGIIITDSVGRPWRLGTVGIAIGSYGINVLNDLRGNKDMYGRRLLVSETAGADSLASASCLVMGEAGEATPVILVRGYSAQWPQQVAHTLLRPVADDMFRHLKKCSD